MKLLIIDLETTGIDPKESKIIEVGAILYSVEHQCLLQQLSTLLEHTENPAQHVNKINPLSTEGIKNRVLLDLFKEWVEEADYLVAYKASFEKSFLQGIGKNKKWICAYEDIEWPNNPEKTSLVNTALNHGVGINHAHRALTDCQLVALLFDRMNDLPALIEKGIIKASEPRYRIIAEVPMEEKDKPKSCKFRWDAINRIWFKDLRQSDFDKEKETWNFKIKVQELAISC